MRVPGMLALAAALTAAPASASSFTVVEGSSPATTPSIVALGTAGQQPPSVLSIGNPSATVANDRVAVIPSTRRRGPSLATLVIRGGVVGTAFAPARQTGKAAEPVATTEPDEQASTGQGEAAGNTPASDAPPAHLPPNGYGKHRQM